MKKFLAIILSVVLIISVCPFGLFSITASAVTSNTTEFAGGSGTEDDPYLISTADHLNNVRKYPNNFFRMINDIDMTNKNFSPIENFRGKFDGGGYRIENLTILYYSEFSTQGTEVCMAIKDLKFGLIAVNNGDIYNLGLTNGKIDVDYSAEVWGKSHVNKDGYLSSAVDIGGIAGENNGTISNCFNENILVVNHSANAIYGTAHGSTSIGGIVGTNNGLIQNCYNVAKMEALCYAGGSTDYGSVSCYAGGIVGWNNSSIISCYNIGNISARRSGQIWGNGGSTIPREGIGGIAGRTHANIEDCVYLSEQTNVSGINADEFGINNTSCDIESMKDKETYSGFDFQAAWEIDNYYEYQFPQLISCRKERIKKIEMLSLPENLKLIEKKRTIIPNAIIEICYEDGYKKQIQICTDMIANFIDKEVGIQNLIIRYGGKEVIFSAEIIAKQLVGISVSKPPIKTEYLERKDDLLLGGSKLKLEYDNDTFEEIDINESMVDGFDNTKPGTQKITVNYNNLSATFFVEIIPKRIIDIAIETLPEKIIYLEETSELDLSGGTVKVFYDNETFQILDMRTLEIKGFDNKKIGTQTLVVDYKGFTDKFDVTVISKTLSGIEISQLPSKLNYLEATETLDLSGGKIKLIYDNMTNEELDLSNTIVSGFNNTVPGEQVIKVVYNEKETQFKIVVMAQEENIMDFAGGIGENYKPYLISTKEHLDNVRKYPGAYFEQVNDIVFSDSDFAIGGTYYNNGYGWMPIGKDSSSAFGGNYDGGGYSIKNLNVDITTANSAYGGLFGYCTGDLKNITIENSDIKVTASGTAYAGGIVGYHKNGTIENCHNNNTTVNAQYGGGIIGYSYYGEAINICSNSGNVDGTYVGGIVGTAVYLSSISDCTNSGDIIKSKTSGAYIGGIVGYNKSGTLDISDCSNSGEIYAEGTDLSSISLGGAPIVGGIVGYSYNTNIDNCSNSANIYGDYAGGIIGYGITIIRDALNIGNISARTNSGGIVGYHNDGSVYTSTNRGDITGVRYVNGNVYTNYSTAVGGIVGAARNGSGIYECANLGTVSNGEYSGGIAGIGDYISQSYNNGTVNSVYYSGGICGEFLDSGSKILNCYNSGKVSGKYAAGLLATMEYGTVQISYNVGKISATENGGYVAAIIAYQTGGTVIDCYYLDDINIGVGYVDYSISNTPETTKLNKANMQNSSNFDGFDFNTMWTMDGYADYYPYPELKNVEMICPHLYDNDCDADCNNCDYVREVEHSYVIQKFDNLKHWDECACGDKINVAVHEFDNSCDKTCDCGYTRTITHNYEFTYDSVNHYNECTVCGDMINITAHNYDSDCDQTCNDCDYVRVAKHTYNIQKFDTLNHWYECVCGEKTNIGIHIYGDYLDASCNLCDNTRKITYTGWHSDDINWYYYESGVVATGWKSVGGTWYYFNQSGTMQTGWQYVGNTWYYMNEGGAMQTGWLQLGNTWYYLGDGGAMQTGWQYIGNTWYYFNASGAWIA